MLFRDPHAFNGTVVRTGAIPGLPTNFRVVLADLIRHGDPDDIAKNAEANEQRRNRPDDAVVQGKRAEAEIGQHGSRNPDQNNKGDNEHEIEFDGVEKGYSLENELRHTKRIANMANLSASYSALVIHGHVTNEEAFTQGKYCDARRKRERVAQEREEGHRQVFGEYPKPAVRINDPPRDNEVQEPDQGTTE